MAEWRRSEQGHAPMINSPQVTQQGWGEGGQLAAKLFRWGTAWEGAKCCWRWEPHAAP